MTVAKATKSPGQKPKTPKKGISTPNVKAPKSPSGTPKAKALKGVGSPKSTPKRNGTPKRVGTPKPAATPKPSGTPKPAGTPMLSGTSKPAETLKKNGTPNKAAISPKGSSEATPKAALKATPKPAGTPKSNGTPKLKATHKATPKAAPKATPKALPTVPFTAATPKATPLKDSSTPKPVKAPGTPNASLNNDTSKPAPSKADRAPKALLRNGTPKSALKESAANLEATQQHVEGKRPKTVKRSASAAGLEKQSGPQEEGRKIRDLTGSEWRHRNHSRLCKTLSSWKSASEDKSVMVRNLPSVDEKTLTNKLLPKLRKHGTVVKHTLNGHRFTVEFSTRQEALDAMDLNGVLFEGKRLIIKRLDDAHIFQVKVCRLKGTPVAPDGLSVESIWKTFEKCGQIYSITKQPKKSYIISFKDKKGQKSALPVTECADGTKIHVFKYFNWWSNVIFLRNLPGDVTENDLEFFFKKACSFRKVKVVSRLKLAAIEFRNSEEAAKALILNGEKLKGHNIELLVSGLVYTSFIQSQETSQMLNKVELLKSGGNATFQDMEEKEMDVDEEGEVHEHEDNEKDDEKSNDDEEEDDEDEEGKEEEGEDEEDEDDSDDME